MFFFYCRFLSLNNFGSSQRWCHVKCWSAVDIFPLFLSVIFCQQSCNIVPLQKKNHCKSAFMQTSFRFRDHVWGCCYFVLKKRALCLVLSPHGHTPGCAAPGLFHSSTSCWATTFSPTSQFILPSESEYVLYYAMVYFRWDLGFGCWCATEFKRPLSH